MSYVQPPHPLLMVPGSIEFSDTVLEANAMPAISHTDEKFTLIFQSALRKLRLLFRSTDPQSQPFILPGSGSMGFDIVATNLIKSGENALCLSNGFFSDKFIDCLQIYGVNTDVLESELGDVVHLDEIEKQLKVKKYKIITITHVDTSSAVVNNLQQIAATVKAVSPETLVVVDGVCSVAVENIEFDNWDIDFVLTASQKAIGVPPGLCICYASARALQAALGRETDTTCFLSLKRWFPVQQSFEHGKSAYFATPPVQLINALDVSLDEILSGPLDLRFDKHVKTSDWFKSEIQSLGLKLVNKPGVGTHALTSPYFPDGIDGAQFLRKVKEKGVVFAFGMHPQIAKKHFRVGHMGVSVMNRNDSEIAFKVIKQVLFEMGYRW